MLSDQGLAGECACPRCPWREIVDSERQRFSKLAAANTVLHETQMYLTEKCGTMAQSHAHRIAELESALAYRKDNTEEMMMLREQLNSTQEMSSRLSVQEERCEAYRQALLDAEARESTLGGQVEQLQEALERIVTMQEKKEKQMRQMEVDLEQAHRNATTLRAIQSLDQQRNIVSQHENRQQQMQLEHNNPQSISEDEKFLLGNGGYSDPEPFRFNGRAYGTDPTEEGVHREHQHSQPPVGLHHEEEDYAPWQPQNTPDEKDGVTTDTVSSTLHSPRGAGANQSGNDENPSSGYGGGGGDDNPVATMMEALEKLQAVSSDSTPPAPRQTEWWTTRSQASLPHYRAGGGSGGSANTTSSPPADMLAVERQLRQLEESNQETRVALTKLADRSVDSLRAREQLENERAERFKATVSSAPQTTTTTFFVPVSSYAREEKPEQLLQGAGDEEPAARESSIPPPPPPEETSWQDQTPSPVSLVVQPEAEEEQPPGFPKYDLTSLMASRPTTAAAPPVSFTHPPPIPTFQSKPPELPRIVPLAERNPPLPLVQKPEEHIASNFLSQPTAVPKLPISFPVQELGVGVEEAAATVVNTVNKPALGTVVEGTSVGTGETNYPPAAVMIPADDGECSATQTLDEELVKELDELLLTESPPVSLHSSTTKFPLHLSLSNNISPALPRTSSPVVAAPLAPAPAPAPQAPRKLLLKPPMQSQSSEEDHLSECAVLPTGVVSLPSSPAPTSPMKKLPLKLPMGVGSSGGVGGHPPPPSSAKKLPLKLPMKSPGGAPPAKLPLKSIPAAPSGGGPVKLPLKSASGAPASAPAKLPLKLPMNR